MKKKIIISVIIVIAVAVVLKITVFKGGNGTEIGYQKEALKKGTIQALVDTTGTLNPVTTVDVGSQVSGKILEIFVDFNSPVKAGEVIAKIDSELFITRVNQDKANYQSAEASLEKSKVSLTNTKRQMDRALELYKKDLLSDEEKEAVEASFYSAKSDLQSAQAGLARAKSQLDSSKVDLAYTIIKSPVDGVVINRAVNVGQTVAASYQAPLLFQIANDLSKMQVECSVDEADIGKVKENQQVSFTVDAYPDDNFTGIVKQVRYSPEIISNVVTYTTIVEVDNPEIKLRPGMTATVSIVIGEAKNKLLVPNAALRFNPPQEVLQAVFTEMRNKRQAEQGQSASGDNSGSQTAARKPDSSGHQFTRGQGGGMRMKDMARVWVEDEKGKLKMIFIQTGVTDNIYTEITSDSLKEGQEVITGEGTADSSDNSRRFTPGMMRFMR
jgi:HlyD family secretion protein